MVDSPLSCLRSRAARIALGVGICVSAALAPAQAGTVIVNTELTAIELSGTGSIPFAGSGDLGDANNGFAFVDANFDISQPAALTSVGTTTIVVDPTGGPGGTGVVSYHAVFDFHLDVVISEVTPGSFHPGLGTSITIPAQASDPLTAELSASFGFHELTGILDGTIVPTINQNIESRTHALGVDINGDGNLDSVTFNALDINYLTESDISFEFPPPNDTLDDLLALVLSAGVNNGAPLVLDGTLEATGINVEFLGSVNPDFAIALGGNIGPSAVPLPASAMLLAGALGGLVGWRRRKVSHFPTG